MSVLGIDIYTETANLHCWIVAAVLAMRTDVAIRILRLRHRTFSMARPFGVERTRPNMPTDMANQSAMRTAMTTVAI